jgi:hypothetical protein
VEPLRLAGDELIDRTTGRTCHRAEQSPFGHGFSNPRRRYSAACDVFGDRRGSLDQAMWSLFASLETS